MARKRYGPPHEATPVSKLESGLRLPVSGLADALLAAEFRSNMNRCGRAQLIPELL